MVQSMTYRFLGLLVVVVLQWTLSAFIWHIHHRADPHKREIIENMNRDEGMVVHGKAMVEYMAKFLQIRYEEAQHQNTEVSHITIVLKNTGTLIIPNGNWSVWFFNRALLERESMLIRGYVIFYKEGLNVSHINGDLYQIAPTSGFNPLQPDQELYLKLAFGTTNPYQGHVLPNWYVTDTDSEPQILRCTLDKSQPDVARSKSRHIQVLGEPPDGTASNQSLKHENMTNSKDYSRFILPTPHSAEFDTTRVINMDVREWIVCTDKQFQQEADLLAGKLSVRSKHYIPPDRFIMFSYTDKVRGHGAYELHCFPTNQTIVIAASSRQGAFYGAQSLLSMAANQDPHGIIIPACNIQDKPKLMYRGLMLDVARSFVKITDLYTLLDVMATYKMNRLHLHLADDEGWRFEVAGLSDLTRVGAHHCHDINETICLMPVRGLGPAANTSVDGFYSAQDYRSLLRYASARHITVIPGIPMPGHSTAAIKAMRRRTQRYMAVDLEYSEEYLLSDPDDTVRIYSETNFINNIVNPCLESTYRFLDLIMTTLSDLHHGIQPLKAIHIGGEVVSPKAFRQSPACSGYVKEWAIKGGADGLMEHFVKRVIGMAGQHKIQVHGWDDFLRDRYHNSFEPSDLQNILPGSLVLHLRKPLSSVDVKTLLKDTEKHGYKVVISSEKFLPSIRPSSTEDQHASLQQVLEYSRLSLEDCIGLEGMMWTGNVRHWADIEEYLYSKLVALAEAAWTRPGRYSTPKDVVDFANIFHNKESSRLESFMMH